VYRSVPRDVDGFRVGHRHAVAEQLALELAAATEPVAYAVVEFRDGWMFEPGWMDFFDTLVEAKAYAATVAVPYRVGVLALMPVDGGRLYPDHGRR
jgi:uncharacterized protein YjhX (UPF0386 family)